MNRLSFRTWLVFLCVVVSAICLGWPTPSYNQIRNNTDPKSVVDYPLPLAGHWNLGESENGFAPEYQMKMVEQGHQLLPWFLMPNIYARPDDPRWIRYYETAIKSSARLKLPISFVGTQWEGRLSLDDEFFKLPIEKNANVIKIDGTIKRELSPFGPPQTWYQVGKTWTSSLMIKRLQELYPNPPIILFVSNNESARLSWKNAEEDRRYIERFGKGRSDDFKRNAVANGWIECYRALLKGMREGLGNNAWRDKAIFIGYDAFGPPHFARWSGWMEYSLYSTGRIDPWPYVWDGASPSYYLFNWSSITDYTVFSPQVESMNWIFMLNEARKVNPNFWFEISTWDGHEAALDNDKRKSFARAGQNYTPERYGGMIQFGMWLLRPRVVREFRAYQDTLSEAEPYFLPIIAAVDRVHNNPVLSEFWRTGQMVSNRRHQHPYQSIVPGEYQSLDRWFLLDTSIDPARPLELNTELPVFALTLVNGTFPKRRWLVYAHSPLKTRSKIKVTIPGYRSIDINVTVGGSFYLVDEKSNSVKPVN